MQNLKWREDINIKNLENEDWSHFEEEFAYSLDISDKHDRPSKPESGINFEKLVKS